MPTQTYGPGTSPGSQSPTEPEWTTGQGIGFLVSFVGWLLAFLGLVGVIISDYIGDDGQTVTIFGSSVGLGVLSAIPGTVVFNKCKRR